MEYFLRLLVSGLTRGSIYALLALGYTMVYGIIQLINFAHGEVYMIGAFIALVVTGILTAAGANLAAIFVIAIFCSIIFSAAYGFTMEKMAYHPLRTAPRLSALISAIGMSLFLQNYVRLAQTSDFLAFPRIVPTISLPSPLSSFVNSNQAIIFILVPLVMLGLFGLIKFTRIGKAMRAASQDKIMSALVGININQIISITFIIGSSLAALGGVLISAHVGQINFYIGFLAGLKAFVAAVLGGIGSVPGAVLGSYILGLSEGFGAGYISSDYEDVFAFVFLVLILVFKPAGLLGRSQREKV